MALLEEHQIEHLIVDTFPEGLLSELLPMPVVPKASLIARLRRDADTPLFFQSCRAFSTIFDIESHLNWWPKEAPPATPAPAIVRYLIPEAGKLDVLLIPDDVSMLRNFQKLGRTLDSLGVRTGLVWNRILETPEETVIEPMLAAQWLCSRVVVGAAGYNLTYELALLGTHHLAIPRTRRFDDQARRAQQVTTVCSDSQELMTAITHLLATKHPREVHFPVCHARDLASQLIV
jgi:hypothetical protein